MARKLISVFSICIILLLTAGCQADAEKKSTQNGFVDVDGKLYSPACLRSNAVCLTFAPPQDIKLAIVVGAHRVEDRETQVKFFDAWRELNGFSESSLSQNFEFKSGEVYVINS